MFYLRIDDGIFQFVDKLRSIHKIYRLSVRISSVSFLLISKNRAISYQSVPVLLCRPNWVS